MTCETTAPIADNACKVSSWDCAGHREYVDSALADLAWFTVISNQAKKEVANLMKIAFVGLAVPGQFDSMSTMVRQLQSRNHDVVMLSLSLVEPLARAANRRSSLLARRTFLTR